MSDRQATPDDSSTGSVAFSARQQRTAALMLALATFFWGGGFTWAKMGGQAIHRTLGLPDGSPFGPIFLLGCRFSCGAIVWLLVIPDARRGWGLRSMGRGLFIGFLVSAGLIIQHLGLDRTSEAVSAFLTSLTILFVPLLMTIVLRRPPRAELWAGVVLATFGVWLMTGATPSGFGLGEILGLLCSFTFSLYILAVNAILPRESPWRMTAAQFITVAVMCFCVCALIHPNYLRPTTVLHVLAVRNVWVNVLLLAVFPTILAFGMLTHFQPRLDATRAALIYLLEPIVAAVYASLAVGHRLTASAIVGGAMILIANVIVELISSRREQSDKTILLD